MPLGAYGLRLRGVGAAERLLVEAEDSWPRYELVQEVSEEREAGEHVGADRAVLKLRSGGEIVIERVDGRIVYAVRHRLSDEELVHPYLAPAAAVIGRWLGRESFHGGAFVASGRVWALLGERGSGKSSTLAWLALHGHDVVCDDMLILRDRTAFLGPRSVDLRADAANELGAGEPLGVIGARERWRLLLGRPKAVPPLGGWVVLDWGRRLGAEKLSVAERVAQLVQHRGLRIPSNDPVAVIELAALPGWTVRRPRGWESVAPAVQHLLEVLAG